VAVVMLRDRRLGRRALVLVALGGVMTAVAFVWLGGLQEGSGEPVVRSGSGNLSWRVQGWSDLVTAWSRSPADWAIGQPVGSGFTRRVEGIVTNTQYGPHDFYIEILVRTGFVGLVAFVALTVGLLRALWRTPARDVGLLGPGMLPALLAMQIVWFLTWPPGSEQGIVTGLATAVAAAQASRRNLNPRPMSPTPHRELTPTGNGRR
jgi:O-Antigen ligase